MKQQLKRYWLAMNLTALDAAIHALRLFCGVSGLSILAGKAEWLSVGSMLEALEKLGLLFVAAFGVALVSYLDAHPLEALIPPDPAPAVDPKQP